VTENPDRPDGAKYHPFGFDIFFDIAPTT
jgi:hypothetical protein